ncbi:hypothetical protein BJ165DRAFT_1304382, partial [Panaeolus papilionaceus]
IWKNTKRTLYWETDIWIVPIHRPSQSHWVLCIAYPHKGELFLFDSLAERSPWKGDLAVCVFLC